MNTLKFMTLNQTKLMARGATQLEVDRGRNDATNAVFCIRDRESWTPLGDLLSTAALLSLQIPSSSSHLPSHVPVV